MSFIYKLCCCYKPIIDKINKNNITISINEYEDLKEYKRRYHQRELSNNYYVYRINRDQLNI